MDLRLVLKRIEVDVMVEKMFIGELLAALIVEDVVVDKFEVGLAKVIGLVAKEFVVDVGIAETAGVVVEEDDMTCISGFVSFVLV